MGSTNLKLPLETINDIIKSYTIDLLSTSKIAKKHNISKSSVLKYLNLNKIDKNPNVYRKYKLNQTILDNIDTEEKAYFLGFFFADGCNCEERNFITISLQEGDREILEKFKNMFDYTGPVRFVDKKTKYPTWQNMYTLKLTSKTLSQRMKSLGAGKAKSLILDFPPNGEVPEHLMRHFIRGYFEGDGSFTLTHSKETRKKNKIWRLQYSFMGSQIFLNKLKSFIQQYIPIGGLIDFKKGQEASIKRLYVNGNQQAIKFLRWIYNDQTIALKRKYDKFVKVEQALREANLLPEQKLCKIVVTS